MPFFLHSASKFCLMSNNMYSSNIEQHISLFKCSRGNWYWSLMTLLLYKVREDGCWCVFWTLGGSATVASRPVLSISPLLLIWNMLELTLKVDNFRCEAVAMEINLLFLHSCLINWFFNAGCWRPLKSSSVESEGKFMDFYLFFFLPVFGVSISLFSLLFFHFFRQRSDGVFNCDWKLEVVLVLEVRAGLFQMQKECLCSLLSFVSSCWAKHWI